MNQRSTSKGTEALEKVLLPQKTKREVLKKTFGTWKRHSKKELSATLKSIRKRGFSRRLLNDSVQRIMARFAPSPHVRAVRARRYTTLILRGASAYAA